MATDAETPRTVLRSCGFGGPADMACPVHPRSKIVSKKVRPIDETREA